MATKLWAVGLLVLTTLLTSAAQLLYKAGIGYFPQYLDWRIILGLFIYAIGAVMLLFAFKGGEVSVLYPIIATSFVWVAIFSWILFGESLSLIKIAGIALIIIGVSTLGFASQTKTNKTKNKTAKKARARRKD
jgi:drug/metabolite transporter (DMT)-like permease